MWILQRFSAALLALTLLAAPARAVTLTVLAPASAAPGLQAAAVLFTAKTGIAITVGGGSRGAILNTLKTHGAADVVMLPTTDLADMSSVQGVVPLGRITVGVGVKAGDKVPDVSTPEKFRAALLAAKGVAYADPAAGTSAGQVIDALLAAPEFKGVKRVPVRGLAVSGLTSGQASIALQMLPELTSNKDVAVAGAVPASYGAGVDFSAGIAMTSMDSLQAEAFISFLASPQNAALWRKYGLEPIYR
jgi:molybdate transport system substrate-binding protein